MKIGILTRRAGFNHGSSLQAYAMYKFLSDLGNDCKIINYDEYSGHILWKVRPFIENIQWNLCKLFPLWRKTKKYQYLYIRKQQYDHFQAYEKKYLPLTSKICRNKCQLLNTIKDFDVLVCGSDQIWSPLLYDPVFVFGFLDKNNIKKTIAYAPSIGVSNKELISDEEINFIKKINFISCREEKGAEILESITQRNVPVVLDPTLMVNKKHWLLMSNSVPKVRQKPYILCYFLGNNIPQKYIDKLKQELGYEIINIQMFNRINTIKVDLNITDLGPCHFLNLIANAEWVCTDSFHATIFSFIFNRKMSIFERFKREQRDNQNSRIHTLLKALDLENVLVQDDDTPCKNLAINFKESEKRLTNLQTESLKFIINALA